MSVVQISQFHGRETASVLKCLLEMALARELTSVSLRFKRPDGSEDTITTGTYAAPPAMLAVKHS